MNQSCARESREAARRAKISATMKGRKHPWAARPDSEKEFTLRHRARKLLKPTACALAHLGHCVKRIDTEHLDGNYLNNDPSNLLGLCRSHHFLYDRGHIDLSHPVMPEFYVSSGKRRYKKRAAA